MASIKYVGIFFDRSTVTEAAAFQRADRLFRTIEHPHVTLLYRPTESPPILPPPGSPVCVTVTGYGCDTENEAFSVCFQSIPAQLEGLVRKIAIPHVTISVSETGEPVNSNTLTFHPIPPFTLEGVFGYMDENGVVVVS